MAPKERGTERGNFKGNCCVTSTIPDARETRDDSDLRASINFLQLGRVEICNREKTDEIGEKKIDVMCIQENKWKGIAARELRTG